jgi:hypothetical protein
MPISGTGNGFGQRFRQLWQPHVALADTKSYVSGQGHERTSACPKGFTARRHDPATFVHAVAGVLGAAPAADLSSAPVTAGRPYRGNAIVSPDERRAKIAERS